MEILTCGTCGRRIGRDEVAYDIWSPYVEDGRRRVPVLDERLCGACWTTRITPNVFVDTETED